MKEKAMIQGEGRGGGGSSVGLDRRAVSRKSGLNRHGWEEGEGRQIWLLLSNFVAHEMETVSI